MMRVSALFVTLGVLALSGVHITTASAAAIYNNSADFFAAISGKYYTETFDGLPTGGGTFGIGGGGGVGTSAFPLSVDFSSNGFSYTATDPGSSFYVLDKAGDKWLSTDKPGDTIVFTFTSGNVTAVGGNFFGTNTLENFAVENMAFSLSDGTSYFFTANSPTDFVGFTTDSSNQLTSLTVALSDPSSGNFPTVNNLTVGSAVVPEASTAGLIGAALSMIGLAAVRRRKLQN